MTPHVFPPPLDGDYVLAADGRVQTRSIEVHVVDHCNITCADCCSLSPLLPRYFAQPSDVARDLARARRVLAPRVVKLVGGEPLLHPDLVGLLTLARASAVAPRVSLTTNGLLLARAPEALWAHVDAITISVYPRPGIPATDVARIETLAARHGVALNWKQQDRFVVLDRPARCDDADENRRTFAACWMRQRCHLVRDGVFYTCTRPPHVASHGGSDPTEDGLRLHDGEDLRDALLAYLRRPEPLATCGVCLGTGTEQKPHRLLAAHELARLRRSV